ncbi:MAG: terminase large subunit, partial [Evtepia sp.]
MTGSPYIDEYLLQIRDGRIPASKEILEAAVLIERKLSMPGVIVDHAKAEKAAELIERYFKFELFDWERLILALVHCYCADDTLVFTEYLIVMGRGNGKNGFISGLAWYLTTHVHGVIGYNVDIIANSEDQAKTSFDDIYEMLEATWEKTKLFFYKSKELIRSVRTKSYIKFNTSNARTKDGKRSACLIFDEIHAYETDDTINVFRSGFGKRKHSRTFYITTNGYVRDGVLDQKLAVAHDVLHGEIESSRLCPLIYKMDSEAECDKPDLWVKANPSLPHLSELKLQMQEDFLAKEYEKGTELDFYTKRMNLPRSNMEIAVTEWENIKATNKAIPDLHGKNCTVGIDYASLRDWAAVNFHFRIGEERIDFGHYWLCTKSPELFRIKAPWGAWAEMGLVTPVDDVEIAPELLADYIRSTAEAYHLVKIGLDSFRYGRVADALRGIGFDAKDRKNVVLIRPKDSMRIQPVIDGCFLNHQFTWGDNPPLRWAVNNTKLVRAGQKEGTDTGNYYYAKIEGKSRKTDPFMALVASMVIEEAILPSIPDDFPDLGIIV